MNSLRSLDATKRIKYLSRPQVRQTALACLMMMGLSAPGLAQETASGEGELIEAAETETAETEPAETEPSKTEPSKTEPAEQAEPSEKAGKADKGDKGDKGDKPDKSPTLSETLRIRGRLQTGWQMTGDTNTGAWSDAFYIRRARLDGRWTPLDWAKLVLELQLQVDGIEARDVYAEFDVNSWFDLTLGYFKKPFSRLRMSSPYDLLIPDRGLLDQQVVGNTKFGGFGARDLGLMLVKDFEGPTLIQDPLKFTVSLGAFNNLPTESNYHRDVVARAQMRLFKGLVLAANGSFKFFADGGTSKAAALLGGDLKWELDPFRLQLEGAFGDNVNTGAKLWGAHAIASYQIPFAPWAEASGWAFVKDWVLTPALMFEAYDADLAAADDLDLRLAGALNLDLNEQIRLVLSLDRTWTDFQAGNSALPDPIMLRLQTNLRFP